MSARRGHSASESSIRLSLVVCFASLSLIGCSEAGIPAALHGTVTFEGKPVEQGAIRFATEDGTPGPGGVGEIQNGRYEVAENVGLKSGKYVVMIYGFRETGRTIQVDDNSPPRKEERQYLPRRYNDATQETIELAPGDNLKDFVLTR